MSTQLAGPQQAATSVTDEQIRTIESGRSKLLVRAEELTICNPETEQVGWAIINGIADLKKMIVADFKEAKDLAFAAHRAICNQEKGHLDALVEPDRIVRGKLSEYDAEKRLAQAEADRRAREEAAADQRRRQAIADEEVRVENERRRKEVEDRRLAEALEAERAGKADIAAAILDKPIDLVPVVAPTVTVAPSVVPSAVAQKVEGAGAMVDNWEFRVINPDAIPREYMVIDEKAIAAIVKRLKKVAEKTIPGIEVFNNPKPRTSGRR